MNNLETLKNELINQKKILENKNYTVTTANTYPSPSEITTSLNGLLENIPEVATYSAYYKTFADPSTFNTVISNLIVPEGTINIRSYFTMQLGEYLTGTVSLPSTVQTIGRNAFAETDITNIVLPNGLTDIEMYAFNGCTKLKKMIMPDTVTSIGAYSFQNCTDLLELHLSESLTEIPNACFKVLNYLSSLTLPASLTKITSNNFLTVPSLEDVYIEGSTLNFSSSTIFSTHNDNLKIWVNFNNIATFANLTNLSKVKDHIISEVTISELTFPTSSISLKWYASITDAVGKINNITTPTAVGTYYCTVG